MKRCKRVFGFPDIHWAVRDIRALRIAIAACVRFRPDTVVVGGDLLDADSFGSFAQTSVRTRTREIEFTPARDFLAWLCVEFPRVIFTEGNHETRIARALLSCGRGVGTLASAVSAKSLLSPGCDNFEWVKFGDVAMLSRDLMVTHGWYAGGNSVKKHIEAVRPRSVIFHHTHRLGYMAETRLGGHTCEALNGGCLCTLSPEYAHGTPQSWAHGFWVAYIGRRSHTLYPVKIGTHGAVLPDGEEVK